MTGPIMTTFRPDWDEADLRSSCESGSYGAPRGAFSADRVEAHRAETITVPPPGPEEPTELAAWMGAVVEPGVPS